MALSICQRNLTSELALLLSVPDIGASGRRQVNIDGIPTICLGGAVDFECILIPHDLDRYTAITQVRCPQGYNTEQLAPRLEHGFLTFTDRRTRVNPVDVCSSEGATIQTITITVAMWLPPSAQLHFLSLLAGSVLIAPGFIDPLPARTVDTTRNDPNVRLNIIADASYPFVQDGLT